VVGKRAGAPEGAAVVIEIGPERRVPIEVVDGRARLAASPRSSPTVSIAMPVATFAALVGGRADAPDDVSIEGDRTLGQAVVDSLAIMP
jgi:hypothetical protein